MALDVCLHLALPPTAIEKLLHDELPAERAPLEPYDTGGVLFRFRSPIAGGLASCTSAWDGQTVGGRLVLPYYVHFFKVEPSENALQAILRVVSAILRTSSEDLMLDQNGAPMVLRREGMVALTTRRCWTPEAYAALGMTGPRWPLWPGDPGWSEMGRA
jgi:hypothetical protein